MGNNGDYAPLCLERGAGKPPMQGSIDSLLIALFVALAPDQDLPPGERPPDRALLAMPFEPSRSGEMAPAAAACLQFADANARRNCEIRARRAGSGTAEPVTLHPETLFWVAPTQPDMPINFGANSRR
jgi:hypothetical protein